MIAEGQSLLREGDLVVRLNRDPLSGLIKNFNRTDKNYSHAGLVFYENGYPYIFHIINFDKNETGGIRKDSLSSFCDPKKNLAFGIFRYSITSAEIKKLKNIIYGWRDKGMQFDSVFNLKSDDKMYCSEMISKALAQATNKRIAIQSTKPTRVEAALFSAYSHLPFDYVSKIQVISIDNLYANSYCQLIKKYNLCKN